MNSIKKFNEHVESFENGITITIPKSIKDIMVKIGIPEENHTELFRSYVEHLLGIDYGVESDEFFNWTNIEDNIVDFLK